MAALHEANCQDIPNKVSEDLSQIPGDKSGNPDMMVRSPEPIVTEQNTVARNWKCPDCEASFSKKREMVHHLDTVHERLRLCDRSGCGKSYKKYSSWMHHKRLHLTKNFTCNQCVKAYLTVLGLEKHMKTHTVRAFHCTICDSFFDHNVALRNHIQLHFTAKSSPCTITPEPKPDAALSKQLRSSSTTLSVETRSKSTAEVCAPDIPVLTVSKNPRKYKRKVQSKTKLQVKADDKIKKEEDCPPLQVVEYDVSDDIFCEKCGELYKSEFLKTDDIPVKPHECTIYGDEASPRKKNRVEIMEANGRTSLSNPTKPCVYARNKANELQILRPTYPEFYSLFVPRSGDVNIGQREETPRLHVLPWNGGCFSVAPVPAGNPGIMVIYMDGLTPSCISQYFTNLDESHRHCIMNSLTCLHATKSNL